MAHWLSWLERRPVTAEVVGSSPSWVVVFGVLAQLGEHLPYKQRVIGSSPIGPTNLRVYAGVAELADAQDLKSCEGKTSYRFDSGRRQCWGAASLCFTGFAAFFFLLKRFKNGSVFGDTLQTLINRAFAGFGLNLFSLT